MAKLLQFFCARRFFLGISFFLVFWMGVVFPAWTAWAKTSEVSYLFKNRNLAIFSIEHDEVYSFHLKVVQKTSPFESHAFLEGEKENLPEVLPEILKDTLEQGKAHEEREVFSRWGAGLEFLETNMGKKLTNRLPAKVRTKKIPSQSQYFSFQDSERYWIFEDGLLVPSCPGKDPSSSQTQLFEVGGQRFLFETTQSGKDRMATLLRVSDGKCLSWVQPGSKHQNLQEKGGGGGYSFLVPEEPSGGSTVDSNAGHHARDRAIDLLSFQWVSLIQHQEERYVLRESPEHSSQLFIIRLSDGKILKMIEKITILSKKSPSLPPHSIEDGILSIAGMYRKIDLNRFDEEVRRSKKLRFAEPVLDEGGRRTSVVQFVLNQYRDLVKESREYPENYNEQSDPTVMRQLAYSVRSHKSSILLGPPGTGKSSAVKAFARDVGKGLVPGVPRTLQIFELNPATFASGTQYTGMIEQRVATLVAAARETGCVFFIDEMHSLMGTGTSKGRPNDVTQYFKGAMESGEMMLIGTDTGSEFYDAFGKDPAFMDRFETVSLTPPEGSALVDLIRKKIIHEFSIDLNSFLVQQAIDISSQFDVMTAQPRAAINLLRKAHVIADSGHDHSGALPVEFNTEVLRAAALEKYHLNSGQMDSEMIRKRIHQLTDGMSQEIVGQSHAKTAMISIWKRKLSGVGDPDHVTSLLFVGAPGVGKTRLASLSADLMGYQKTVIEMNRFQKGDIDEFRREVYSALLKSTLQVFLFDEIEKAHLSVQEAALSMLQNGKFTVSEKLPGGGFVYREVSAKNALFILTSNAGSDYIEHNKDAWAVSRGGQAESVDQSGLRDVLVKEGISPAILSRILRVVPLFRPSETEFRHALTSALKQTLAREGLKHHVQFELTNEAQFLDQAMQAYSPECDYRDVKKMILPIEEKMADVLLAHPMPGLGGGISMEFIQITWDPSLEPLPKKRRNEAWRSMYL